MITSIDLLLALGGKIADILALLLQKKLAKEEKEQVELLLQEYNQIKEAHRQIKSVLLAYNQGLAQAVTRQSDLQKLFPICTYKQFQRIQLLHRQYTQSQITAQVLEGFNLLSINLITVTERRQNALEADVTTGNRAEAYAYEQWVNVYQTGQRQEQRVVNYYSLAREDTWKVDKSVVFVQTA